MALTKITSTNLGAAPIAFANSSANVVAMAADGRVGIGLEAADLSNFGRKLLVNGTGGFNSNTGTVGLGFSRGASNTYGYIGTGDWAVNGLANVDFGISSGSAGALVLGTGAGTERARIDTNGSMIIGGTAIKNGDGYDSNRTFLTLQAKTGGVDRGALLELVGTGGGSPNYWLGAVKFYSTGNPKAHAAITSWTDSGGNNSGALIFYTNTSANNADPIERLRINSSGAITAPYQPAFRAYLSTEWTTVAAVPNSGWTEQFDRGNNFNQGTFTAPIAGVYKFGLMWDANASATTVSIRQNGSAIASFEPSYADGWESNQLHTVINMAANDYVNIYIAGGSGSNPFHMGGAHWGYFYGYLIG